LKHFHPFPDQGEVNECEAGDVAARARQAGDETLSDRIANDAKHDRDGVGCLFQRGHNHRAAADDKVRCRTYQPGRVGLDSAQISTVISMIDSDIAVLRPMWLAM
jgi:hypothetical protein